MKYIVHPDERRHPHQHDPDLFQPLRPHVWNYLRDLNRFQPPYSHRSNYLRTYQLTPSSEWPATSA